MTQIGERVQLRSIRGSTPEATEALKTLIYIDEVERQAQTYNAAFADAMRTAARGDASATFRHIQAGLFAAIIVYRLVKNQAVPERSSRLRDLLGLAEPGADTPILSMSRVRDHLEHFDERLDAALGGPGASLSDWYLTNKNLIVSADSSDSREAPRAGLRAFSPRLGTLYFDDQQLDMIQLDIDLLKLRGNAVEARADLKQRIKGRSHFGGDARFLELPPGNRVETWHLERARLIREIDSTET